MTKMNQEQLHELHQVREEVNIFYNTKTFINSNSIDILECFSMEMQ